MGKKVYVYESDDGFDIFLKNRKLTDEERYCSQCGEYALLLTETSDINSMIEFFPNYGYTPETSKYQELIEEFNEILNGRVNSN